MSSCPRHRLQPLNGCSTLRYPSGGTPWSPSTPALGQIPQADLPFEFFSVFASSLLWTFSSFVQKICHSGQLIQLLLLIKFILFPSGLLFIISLQFQLSNISHFFSYSSKSKMSNPCFPFFVNSFLVHHKPIIHRALFFINTHKFIFQIIKKGTWLQRA